MAALQMHLSNLTQTRLGVFLVEKKTGKPLSRVLVYAEVAVTLPDETARLHRAITDNDSESTPKPHNQLALPLGVLATDHSGYASFDLSNVPSILGAGRPRAATAYSLDFIVHPGLLESQKVSILSQARLNKDAIFGKILLSSTILTRSCFAKLGLALPSLQKPSMIDWYLSPGSFAAVPQTLIGADGCETFTPANFAVSQYSLRQVLRAAADPSNPTLRPEAFVNEYTMSFIPIGHSLGSVLYSLPLAPGESVRLAVIDWRRQDDAARTETTVVTEALVHDQTLDRTITETVSAALSEYQHGGSVMGGFSGGGGGAGTGGTYSAAGGAMFSIGGGSTNSSGVRNLTASSAQHVADAVHQASVSNRELQSSVVVQVDSKESENIATRTFFNNNRGHTMTVLYYEILRHYRLLVHFNRRYKAVLVDRQRWDFGTADPDSDEVLVDYQYVLRPALLDASLAPAFDAVIRADTARHELVRSPSPPPPVGDGTLVFDRFTMHFVVGNQHSKASIWLWVEPKPSAGQPRFQLNNIKNDPNLNSDWQFNINSDPGGFFIASQPIATPIKWDDIATFTLEKVDGDEVRVLVVEITGWSGNTSRVVHTHFMGATYDMKNDGDSYTLPCDQPPPPPAGSPARNWKSMISSDDYANIMRLRGHLNANYEYYARILDFAVPANTYATQFESMPYNPAGGGDMMVDVVAPTPLEISGKYLAFPRLDSVGADADPTDAIPDTERLISFSTRGVFAEAHLGHCNVAEEIDETRFWRWDEHPNPLTATEINPITAVTPTPGNIASTTTPTTLPNAVVNIQNPLTAPDPASLSSTLTAITKGDSFRDMSGVQQVAGMLSDLTKAAVSMAQAAAGMLKPSGSGSGTSTGSGTGHGSTPGGGSSSSGSGSSKPKPAPKPVTTTAQQQTTPTQAHDAIKVTENQMKKGNVSQSDGSAIIASQLSNMKGSKPVGPPAAVHRAILFRLIGWGGNSLDGQWTWELTQLQIMDDGEALDAGLAGDETPRRFTDGRIVANFEQSDVDGGNFDFHLKGQLFGSPGQISVGEGMLMDKVVHFTVPAGKFDTQNIVTVTLTATTATWTSANMTGSSSMTSWQEGANASKLIAGVNGSVSGQHTSQEVQNDSSTETWTYVYYTGGFDENVRVE